MRDLTVAQVAEHLGVSSGTVRRMADDGRLPHYRLPGSGFRRFKREEIIQPPSYHDLHITTASIPRTSIFNLVYGLEVSCTRVGGWELWDHNQKAPAIHGSSKDPGPRCVASEYPDTRAGGLLLDVAGHVICDSLTPIPASSSLWITKRPG